MSTKTPAEIKTLREGGKRLASVVYGVAEKVAPGVTALDLEQEAHRLITTVKGRPAFLGYQGYPAAACISLNNQVVHGIPRQETVLQDGDIVSIDIGLVYQELYTDMAITVGVGTISREMNILLETTAASLEAGIAAAEIGHTLGDVGHEIETVADEGGFSVVRQLVGHGVGHAVHEPPQVPNYGAPSTGEELVEGMVIAIEPMLNVGNPGVKTLADGWTIVTVDDSRSAHFEHTIAVTKQGPEILTAK